MCYSAAQRNYGTWSKVSLGLQHAAVYWQAGSCLDFCMVATNNVAINMLFTAANVQCIDVDSRTFRVTMPLTWLCRSTTTRCLKPSVLNTTYVRSNEKDSCIAAALELIYGRRSKTSCSTGLWLAGTPSMLLPCNHRTVHVVVLVFLIPTT